MKKYIFNVDHDINIVIDLGHVIPGAECFCDATVFMYYGDKKHQFMVLFIKDDVEFLKEGMLQGLDNKLALHQSLVGKDLGFLFNQHMYESGQEKNFSGQPKVVCSEEDVWVGAKYQMWGGTK